MKSFSFDKNYFISGPYRDVVFTGWKKYLGQYFWARRFYVKLIKKYKKHGRVLEIGCGFGDLLRLLEKDFQTYGIDLSKEAIKEGKKRTISSVLKVMKAETIDVFKKHFFDVIIACHLLEHLKEPGLVIAKMSRILKDDGIVLIAVPNTTSLGKKIKKENWVGFRDKTHLSLLPPKKWLQLLRKNYFKPFKVFSDGLWDAPYLPFIPSFLQKAVFGLPAGIQTAFGLPFLSVPFGESLIILAKKRGLKNL